jgi:hypothetical protein
MKEKEPKTAEEFNAAKIRMGERSWFMALYRGPKENDEYFLSSVELPGGKDDAGLMESDLTVLASALREHAHDDLTQKEIEAAVLEGLRENVVVMGRCVGTTKKVKK